MHWQTHFQSMRHSVLKKLSVFFFLSVKDGCQSNKKYKKKKRTLYQFRIWLPFLSVVYLTVGEALYSLFEAAQVHRWIIYATLNYPLLVTSCYWKSIHRRPDAYMKQPSGLCSRTIKVLDILYHFEKSCNFYPVTLTPTDNNGDRYLV